MTKEIVSYEDEAEKQLSEEQQQEIVKAIKSRKKRIKSIKKEIEKLEKKMEENKEEIKKLNTGDTSVIEKINQSGSGWFYTSPTTITYNCR